MACLGTGEGEMGSLPIDYNAKHTLGNIFSIYSIYFLFIGEMGSLPIDYNAKHTLSNIFSIGSFIDGLKEHGTDGKCILIFSQKNQKDFRKPQGS